MAPAKEELKKLVDEWFYGDVDDAEDAIRNFLMLSADHTEETEPYATVTIQRARAAASGFSLEFLKEG